jgi:hypothetical protein
MPNIHSSPPPSSSTPNVEPGAELPLITASLFDAEAHLRLRTEMEALSERLRVAVLRCHPKQMIGFLWGQLLMSRMGFAGDEPPSDHKALIDDVMFALEYVHAVLSGHFAVDHGTSATTEDLNAVLELSAQVRQASLLFCLVAAQRMPEGLFGGETGMVAMQALSSWVSIRGHRYQALEGEFFAFVLEPHDDALRRAYGVGAEQVAAGIQAAVDATRYGHMHAADVLQRESKAAYDLADKEQIDLGEAISRIHGAEASHRGAAQHAISELFFGGICNVSKTSGLPPDLLADLTYAPGDEEEFFAAGPLCGTPLRRMPGRVKPLVAIDGESYTCDANFIRDSAYRALQWGLLKRIPEYNHEWLDRQTALTEAAFMQIFDKQLVGAEVLTSIYYPDPQTGKWVENDVLILLDDALLQVEVKAGIMPMHSPAVHFERHVGTIQELVVKAHHQCERFLEYAASAAEVPLYQLVQGTHREVRRLRLAAYRVVLPIGLTVEAFTPFSSMCKRLNEVHPILGKHPFISMSIDDLFVLARLLPTSGELIHYLSVRQRVAGLKDVFVFDELDHLGGYVSKNRSDMFYAEKLAEGANWLTEADSCAPVDNYFANPDWQTTNPPKQVFPPILRDFLQSIEAVRRPHFLAADAAVRDLGAKGRQDMAYFIGQLLPSLQAHPFRWFMLMLEDEPLMIWLQRSNYVDIAEVHKAKAEAVALFAQSSQCTVVFAFVEADGKFMGGVGKQVIAPRRTDANYSERLADAERMGKRTIDLKSVKS